MAQSAKAEELPEVESVTIGRLLKHHFMVKHDIVFGESEDYIESVERGDITIDVRNGVVIEVSGNTGTVVTLEAPNAEKFDLLK